MILSFLRGHTFSHGVRVAHHKEQTASRPIRRLPFPERLILPLDPHIGKPAVPLVRRGQEVVRGEPIARADGWMSLPIHAPATGRVVALEPMPTPRGPRRPAIVLEVDPADTQEMGWGEPRDPLAMDRETLIAAIQESGLAGLGGAAFPTHVKLSVPPEQRVDTLLINGCECEPYLTCDHRIMLEQTDDLVTGIRIAMRATGVQEAVIGVENNKPDAVAAIRAGLREEDPIRVVVVESKYPQGAEKMLIKAALGREVPPGGIPAQVGVVVNNVGTMAALGHLLPRGEGLVERVITVAGPAVRRPGNYRVALGTPIEFILRHCGFEGKMGEFILGGPMMGSAVSAVETPITKGTSGVLMLHEREIEAESRPAEHCIRCGRCVEACPMHLNPCELGWLARKREYDTMAERFHLMDCFECGCCSFVCPASIPLVQYFRIAKSILREQAA